MTAMTVVRAAKEGAKEYSAEDDDVSFGVKEKEAAPESTITKMPMLFERVSHDFQLKRGHKIGMAVHRTYEITHEDAEAAKTVDLLSVFGQKRQPCIYTGTVTEMSPNGKSFLHNINTFEGCSGAVIFLLDQGQPSDVLDKYHGCAVAVHCGGVDDDNNYAFMIPRPP